MRPTKRLTALVSKLSTVRMIDGLSLKLSAYARVPDPIWDKGKRVGRARIQAAPRLKDRKNDGSSFISPLGSLDLGRSRTTLV